MMENKTIASIKVDIARLEEKNNSLNEKVDEIKNNHLAHIAADIKGVNDKVDRLSLKIAYWTGGLLVATSMIQYIIYYFIYKH